MRGMKAPSNGFDARALGSRRVCSRSRGDRIRLEGFANALACIAIARMAAALNFSAKKNVSPRGEALVEIVAHAVARCAAPDWTRPAEANEPRWEKSERSKQLAWKEERPTRHCEKRNRVHGGGVHSGKAAVRRSPHPAARRPYRKRRLLPAQRRLRPRSWSARA